MSRSSEGQGHNDACLWKGLDQSTMCVGMKWIASLMKKLLEENKTWTQIVYDARRQSTFEGWRTLLMCFVLLEIVWCTKYI